MVNLLPWRRNRRKANGLLITLDIDGVLAPLQPLAHDSYVEVETGWAAPWRVDTAVVDWLKSLGPEVTYCWGTMWMGDAFALSEAMGLPVDGYIDFDLPPGESDWVKWAGYRSFLEAVEDFGHVLVLDDEASPMALEWASGRTDVTFYAVEGERGLAADDFRSIEKILAARGFLGPF